MPQEYLEEFISHSTSLGFEIFNTNETLFDLKHYIVGSLNKYNNFLKYSKDLTKYKSFNDAINTNISIFTSYLDELNKITPYTLNINKLVELGQLMKCFYYLNKN